MKKQITSYGIPHEVTRANLYEDAIALYCEEGENIVQEYPFRIKFKGEKAVDCGGVSRDMLSGFWEVAYQTVFDGGSLLTPLVSSDTDMNVLPTGTIISHGYLACGFIPVRIAFPSLAAVLLGPMVTIPHHILVDTFVNSLSAFEAGKLKKQPCSMLSKETAFLLTLRNRWWLYSVAMVLDAYCHLTHWKAWSSKPQSMSS